MTLITSEPRRSTQKERVKEILRGAGASGICTFQFNALGLPNGRNRVYELRDDDHLDIETVGCDLEAYHHEEVVEARRRGDQVEAHVRFVWHWHAKPRQLALAIT